MTAISYHDTVNDLQGLAFAGRGPFARPEWFARLEKAAGQALFALARDGDDAVALPLIQANGGLEGLTNWYAFTWSDLATGDAPREALLERLARGLADRTSRISLAKLPDENGTATRLERAFRRGGWVVERTACDANHGLAYIHKLAHLESAKPLSAGTTLTAALFEQAIDRDRAQWVDFGTGDDPYKRDWMDRVRPRYRLTCWRREDPRNWPAIGKALLRQLVSRPAAG